MQNFMSVLNSAKKRVVATYGAIADRVKSLDWERVFNALTIIAFVSGLIALVVLVWLYVRPIPLANIKVPVATDQASYAPGEEISGIFFGDTYYTGEVRVLREVFCKDYKGIIKPPPESAVGDFFSTQGKPRHLEGQSVLVGNLPADIPVGLNCVLQFTNIYNIQTPFGVRHEEYQYYTQNFSILSQERRNILECEATGRKDCARINEAPQTPQVQSGNNQSSPESAPVQQQPAASTNTTNNTTNNTTINNPPATTDPVEPAPRYEERCTISLLGIKVNCRQVQVN